MGRFPIFHSIFLLCFGASHAHGYPHIHTPRTRNDFQELIEFESDAPKPSVRTIEAWISLSQTHNIKVLKNKETILGFALSEDRGSHVELLDFWTTIDITTRDRERLFEAIRGNPAAPHVIAFSANGIDKAFLESQKVLTQDTHSALEESMEKSFHVRLATPEDGNAIINQFLTDEHSRAVYRLASNGFAPQFTVKVLFGPIDHSLLGAYIEERLDDDIRIHAMGAMNRNPSILARLVSEVRKPRLKVSHHIMDQDSQKFLNKLNIDQSNYYWQIGALRLTNSMYGHTGAIRKAITNNSSKEVGHIEYKTHAQMIELKKFHALEAYTLSAEKLAAFHLLYEHFRNPRKSIAVRESVHKELHFHFRNLGFLPSGKRLVNLAEKTEIAQPVGTALPPLYTLYELLKIEPDYEHPSLAAKFVRIDINEAEKRLILHYEGKEVDQLMPFELHMHAKHIDLVVPKEGRLTEEEITEAAKAKHAEIDIAVAILSDEDAKYAYDHSLFSDVPRTPKGELILSEKEKRCLARYRQLAGGGE